MDKQQSCDLAFFVNGAKITKSNPDPRTVLVDFLRKELKLTGTKLSCGEGGCGACTVLISRFDRKSSKILHWAANACLIPICSLHGLAVTTVEALGSTRNKLHPIQERLVSCHGVQCGFCSPGMVMSMFALLRSNPQPSEEQIERALKGNLCRCTGYRPILDAFRIFAKSESSVTIDADLTDSQQNATQELIFPSELQLCDEYDRKSLSFGSRDDVLWYRPVSLDELLNLKKQYPDAVLASGGSSIAFMLKSPLTKAKPRVVIATSMVVELYNVTYDDNQLFVGAHTSMSVLEGFLTQTSLNLPAYKTKLAVALLDILKVFGSTQIRNVAPPTRMGGMRVLAMKKFDGATVGGSLALASSSADINAVLLVSDCRVEISSSDGKREVSISEFFTGPKLTCLQPNEVLMGVKVPFSSEDEYFASFKQSPRVDMSLGDVVAAISVRLNGLTVESARLSTGGVAMPCMKLLKSVNQLNGRTWNAQLFETILPDLFAEIKSDTASDEANRYRLLSLQGFLMKFFLRVSAESNKEQMDLSESDQLYLELVTKRSKSTHHGVQLYDVQQPLSDTDSVGQPRPHQWAKQCSTGEAVFTDDILPAEGELYVELVGGSKANSRIVKIDTSDVLSTPGVVGFLDHKSVPGSNLAGAFRTIEVFASEQVNYVNEVIGAVVANSPGAAKLGASRLKVEYEELGPPIVTIEEAIAKGSFHSILPKMGLLKRGDVDAAFKLADHVIEREIKMGGQEHFYMESNGARVVPKGEDGELDVYIGTQVPSSLQRTIAHAMNVDANKVTLHMKRMGGAFGGKESRSYIVAIPAAVAAAKFNRPARCILTRQLDMQITGHRRPNLFKYKVGFNSTGKIMALDLDIYGNEGYYPEIGYYMMNKTLLYIDGCYSIPNISVRGHLCKTNLQSRVPMRGAGTPQAQFLIENVVEAVASFLKLPAYEVKQLNLYKPGELTVGNMPVDDVLGRCFDEVLKQSDYIAEYQRIVEFNQKSKLVKRGISVVPIRFAPTLPAILMQGSALVHIYLDGSVLLTHGGAESGQGINTKMLQIASRALECPVENIHMSEVCTAAVANSSVTGGSSGSDLNGMAVLSACEPLAERLRPYKKAQPNGTWKEWVNAAYNDRVGLSNLGFWSNQFKESYNCPTDEGQYRPYLAYGAGVTQVELDCLTGRITIPRVDIVADVGKSLNPAIDVGQIEGAFVMGLGLYSLEDHRYAADGRLETVGAGKYYVPTVGSIPLTMNVTILKDSENQHAVYSSKGIGEPPLLTSVSVFCAIKEAVAAARSDVGLPQEFRLDSPATVSRILLATRAE